MAVGFILKVNKKHATIMTDESRFIKIKLRPGMAEGILIEFTSADRVRIKFLRTLAICFVAIMVSTVIVFLFLNKSMLIQVKNQNINGLMSKVGITKLLKEVKTVINSVKNSITPEYSKPTLVIDDENSDFDIPSATSVQTSTTVTSTAVTSVSVKDDSKVLFSEYFDYPEGLITNQYTYLSADDPQSVKNSNWIVSSGSLFSLNKNGWTGVPDEEIPDRTSSKGTGSGFFRMVSHQDTFQNISISLKLLVERYVSTEVRPINGWDGVSIMFRYIDDKHFYCITTNRRDGICCIKKKIDDDFFVLAKADYKTPLQSWQDIMISVKNTDDGYVHFDFNNLGNHLLSYIDDGSIGGTPFLKSGAVGFRSENTSFCFDDFIVSEF